MDIKSLKTSDTDFWPELKAMLEWESVSDQKVFETVNNILADVRKRGDAALVEHTNLYDRMQVSSMAELEISAERMQQALTSISRDQREALELAAERALEEEHRKAERERLAASYDADLERWMNGEPVHRWFGDVRLRINGKHVETSTGQSATVESVRRALPIVLRRRNSFGPVCNLMVDSFEVVEQSTEGVKVGCTLVPWAEVERLQALLST